MRRDPPLRFTTWLAPGLPEALFETIASQVSARLGRSYALDVEPKISGPVRVEDDRFARGETDVGFLCPPSFLWLSERSPSSIALVPVAPVYDDARSEGRPVYFSDIVVRTDSKVRGLEDLRGRRMGFNDRASLSGYLALLKRLADMGLDPSFFGELRHVGGHRQALSLIAAGEIDAAAVDANVWRAWQRELPAGADPLRSVETLGPFPVQPIAVRATVADVLLDPVTEALRRPATVEPLRRFGVRGFAEVSFADYEALAPLLAFTAQPGAG